MKIGGPKPPAKPPVSGPEGKPKAEAESTTFAEHLAGPEQARQASAADGARPHAAALEQIVAELRSGKVDSVGAAQQLMQRVVAARTAELAPELREQLQQALERVLRNDPTLAAKLRRLAESAEADR